MEKATARGALLSSTHPDKPVLRKLAKAKAKRENGLCLGQRGS